jgi:polyphosphate glucokinase
MTTGAATTSGSAGGAKDRRDWPADVRTLAIDVGGSGFKAAVLARDGTMLTDRAKVETPYPCPPPAFLEAIRGLVGTLSVDYHRVSVGFPGLVRRGRVYHIPSLSRLEYGGPADPELTQAWSGFDLGGALTGAFSVPVKVANDADVQGCAVAQGNGFELVLTLGTGVGTALFSSGVLLPHLELGHAQFRKGETYEEQLGNLARKEVGIERWSTRLLKALDSYDRFLFFDHVYLGGGNSKHLDPSTLPAKATIVPNTAGILGGVRLWDMDLHV